MHGLGPAFGSRHLFALVQESKWPAVVFGEHNHFSIMNYGETSRLTDADRRDPKTLYSLVWSGKLIAIDGSPIRLVTPYHQSGVAVGAVVA